MITSKLKIIYGASLIFPDPGAEVEHPIRDDVRQYNNNLQFRRQATHISRHLTFPDPLAVVQQMQVVSIVEHRIQHVIAESHPYFTVGLIVRYIKFMGICAGYVSSG